MDFCLYGPLQMDIPYNFTYMFADIFIPSRAFLLCICCHGLSIHTGFSSPFSNLCEKISSFSALSCCHNSCILGRAYFGF